MHDWLESSSAFDSIGVGTNRYFTSSPHVCLDFIRVERSFGDQFSSRVGLSNVTIMIK